jgi:hypothetical protein
VNSWNHFGPNLAGYYFIVIRALESSTALERLDTISQKTASSRLQDNGFVNGVNVYLVVCRGGICTVPSTVHREGRLRIHVCPLTTNDIVVPLFGHLKQRICLLNWTIFNASRSCSEKTSNCGTDYS